ncbi:MAG: hypothetical protein HGA62_08065 [Chlorobiaceae bacterium]|nr:hypothetical protein [Chlorobiaceae bacterium]NTV60250.1 hypothetical protein [Chlorobiaceae bacterium]
MAQEEKKRGFFARFRKSAPEAPKKSVPAPKAQPPVSKVEPSVRVPGQMMQQMAESKAPAVTEKKSVPNPFTASSSASPEVSSSSGIEPVAAFREMCQAFVDINKSQVMAIDMALTMLSNVSKKIADGIKKQ